MESQRGRSAVAWLAGLASVCALLLVGAVGAGPASAQGTGPTCLDPGADAFDGDIARPGEPVDEHAAP